MTLKHPNQPLLTVASLRPSVMPKKPSGVESSPDSEADLLTVQMPVIRLKALLADDESEPSTRQLATIEVIDEGDPTTLRPCVEGPPRLAAAPLTEVTSMLCDDDEPVMRAEASLFNGSASLPRRMTLPFEKELTPSPNARPSSADLRANRPVVLTSARRAGNTSEPDVDVRTSFARGVTTQALGSFEFMLPVPEVPGKPCPPKPPQAASAEAELQKVWANRRANCVSSEKQSGHRTASSSPSSSVRRPQEQAPGSTLTSHAREPLSPPPGFSSPPPRRKASTPAERGAGNAARWRGNRVKDVAFAALFLVGMALLGSAIGSGAGFLALRMSGL